MRFNTKFESTKTPNLAGGQAYSMTPELELIHAVLTTFLDDKYYEAASTRLDRVRKLIACVDPVFALKLAVVARKEFHMRSVSHLLLGEVSKVYRGKDDLLKRAIIAAAQRPDDLTELASYVGVPLTKQVKRGIRNALLKFDRYALSKYKAEGKKISLVDLFNLTHPKVQHASVEQREAWVDLVAGKLKLEGAWESEISATKGDEGAKVEVWEDLVRSGKIGYMALLRNLNNLLKSNVSPEVIEIAATRLADPEAVAKSKQLPFRFYTAYQNVKGNRTLSTAIGDALDISVDNVPEFDGKTLIAVDCSGSMDGDPKIKAALLAGALMKRNLNSDVVLYGTSIQEYQASSRTPIVNIIRDIERVHLGGTRTSLVFTSASDVYDRVVILSDNQSWAEGYWDGSSVVRSFGDYKERTGADPFVYAIDIEGYGTTDMAGGKVFHLTGWSDRILDFMQKVEGSEKLVDYIQNYEL